MKTKLFSRNSSVPEIVCPALGFDPDLTISTLRDIKMLKAVDTIGNYSLVSIKPYLVTSNGERLTVKNIVINGSL